MKKQTIYISILLLFLFLCFGCSPVSSGVEPGGADTQDTPFYTEDREPVTIPGTVHGTESPETEPPLESDVTTEQGTVTEPGTSDEPPVTEPDVTTEEYIYTPDTDSLPVKPNASKFIYIDNFLYQSLDSVRTILEEKGIGWSVSEEQYSEDYDKGIILAVKHSGMIYGDKWVFVSGDSVTLTVSRGKRPQAAADSKICYLTFDDGPRAGGTDDVIATLDKYGVKATFFLVGEFMNYYPAQVNALVDAGHVIGCHSMSHVYKEIYASGAAMEKDVTAWMSLYKSITGQDYTHGLYRFPGGSTCYQIKNNNNRNELLKALSSLGFSAFDWTALNNDQAHGDKPAEQSMEDYLKQTLIQTVTNVERGKKKPLIILVHETNAYTRAQLSWMIEYLSDKGYTFDTLDNYNGNWLFG